jgi:Leucine-rich repeat (LRR) protein
MDGIYWPTADYVLNESEDLMHCVLAEVINVEGLVSLHKLSCLSRRWKSLVHRLILLRYRSMRFRCDRFIRHFADEITELNLNPIHCGSNITNSGFESLSNLTALDLTQNDRIADNALQCHASSLRSLVLDSNKLIRNKTLSKCTSLTSLKIRRSNAIISKLTQLTNLTHLSLMIKSKFAESCLRNYTSLTSLSLSASMISEEPRSNILAQISSLVSIQSLEFRNINIEFIALGPLTNLTSLKVLGATRIGDSSLMEINATKLTTLCLRAREQALSDTSIIRFPNLTHLELPSRSFFSNEAVSSLHNLTSLSLMDSANINDDGIKQLTNLTTLRLICNRGITNESIIRLSSNLKNLDLHLNDLITDDALSRCIHLTDLVLGKNVVISNSSLKHCTALVSLDLHENSRITIDGISESSIRHMTFLGISNNRLFLSEDLMRFSNLKSLDMEYNKVITQDAIDSLSSLTALECFESEVRNTITWPIQKEYFCGGIFPGF